MKSINLEALLKQTEFRLDPDARVWTSAHHEFNYNDGDAAENYVLDSVRNTEDVSCNSEELAEKIKDWPSLYHLSHRRSNLLKPFEEWFKGKQILEIGCGCGAISRFIGEAGASLVSVEGSLRRATIARERCRDLENVEVICSPSDQLPNLGKFDAVLLIGVLEYARCFLGKDGQEILLKDCHSRLVENGQLFIAIENKLGIKYFAGAPEDHVGIPMHGINSAYTNDSVATFGRYELKDLINHAGFKEIEEYLPLPDYKLPCSVVTPLGREKYSKELASFAMESTSKDAQGVPDPIFSVEQGIKNIWNNNLASDLSNSFLMIASNNSPLLLHEHEVAYHYSNDRKLEYQKTLVIKQNNKLIKGHPAQLVVENLLTSDQSNNKIQSIDPYFEFIHGESLFCKLLNIVNRDFWTTDEHKEWITLWLEALVSCNNLSSITMEKKISGQYLDATPFNAILTETGLKFFDLEWSIEPEVELGYVIYRGLLNSFLKTASFAQPQDHSLILLSDIISCLMSSIGMELTEEKVRAYLTKERKLATTILNTKTDNDELFHHVMSKKIHIRRITTQTRLQELSTTLQRTDNALKEAQIFAFERLDAIQKLDINMAAAQKKLTDQTQQLKEINEYKKSRRYRLLQFLKILK